MLPKLDVAGQPIPGRAARRRGRYPLEILIDNTGNVTMGASVEPFALGINTNDVLQANRGWLNIFEQVRQYIIDQRHQAVSWDLGAAGQGFLRQLRDHSLGIYHELNFAPFQNGLDNNRKRVSPRDVSLTFRARPDWLLWWDAFYEPEVNEDPSFGVAAERFWGFKQPIGLIPGDPRIVPEEQFYTLDGIYSAINEGLAHSRSEIEQLGGMVVQVRQNFGLEKLCLKLLEQDIPAELLSTEELIKRFRRADFHYGIVHFACHCENPAEEGVGAAALLLKAKGHKIEISINEMRKWLGGGGFYTRPLVFLNACETSTLGHLETANLPSSFLKFNAGGVIATACTLPDDFASAFATYFYGRLFKLTEEDLQVVTPADEFESNIGEALLAARWHFWKKYNNPLGLAYALYTKAEPKLVFSDEE